MLLKKDLSQCKDLRTVEHLAQQFGWYAAAWTPQEPHLICSDEQFTEFAKALPKDTVISQTPGQGEAAEPSAAIKLVVSTGVVSTDPAEQTVKLQVTVPDTGKHSTLNIYVDGELQLSLIHI